MGHRFITACALCVLGCTPSPTSVRLNVIYDEAWGLTALEVTAPAFDQSDLPVAPELRLLLPDDWAGQPLSIGVFGLQESARFASGSVEVTPLLGAEIRDQIILAPCVATTDTCGSTCIDKQTDVNHCGTCDNDCTALPGVDPAKVTCVKGACVLACLAGRGACTGAAGCEADLTTAQHCGSCTVNCSGSTPYCALSGGSYACTGGCSDPTPDLCGTSCVNEQSDPNHCGSCNACPQPAHSTATCTGGTCGFTCNATYHKCGGECKSNSSLESCGSSCTACTPPAHAMSTCNGTSCGFTCTVNYHNCSGACVSNGSINSCGASCAACTPPAHSTATCDGTSCGFTCDPEYEPSGGSCVTACAPYVIGNSGTTVLDTVTNLEWQRGDSVYGHAWSGAGTYCTELDLAGGGWRLPTISELETLLVPQGPGNPCISACAFPGTSGLYWSSTPYDPDHYNGMACAVEFDYGSCSSTYYDKSGPGIAVRCVR